MTSTRCEAVVKALRITPEIWRFDLEDRAQLMDVIRNLDGKIDDGSSCFEVVRCIERGHCILKS